jgi:hypothetical protein
MRWWWIVRVLPAVLSVGAAFAAEPSIVVAGLRPDQRPVAAPVIKDIKKDAAWYRQYLRGIEEPYPASLRFLEDQGTWYTPFNRPNVGRRYDIRGLTTEVPFKPVQATPQ